MKYSLLQRRREQRASVANTYRHELVLDCEALYKGGEELEARLERFMPQPDLMSARTYQTVLSVARVNYVNLFALVVNYYSSFLFGFPLIFKTPTDAFYGRLKDNCDGNGTKLHDYLQVELVELLAGGMAATIVERKEVPRAPRNAAEADEMGARDVVLRRFGANEIFDYELDQKGELKWIVLGTTEYPRESPADEGDKRVERYWVHTRQRTEYYEIHVDRGGAVPGENDLKPSKSVPNATGRVPVELWALHDGIWLGAQLRSPCVANYRARTALSYHNNKTAFPVIVQKTEDTASKPQLGDHGIRIGVKDEIAFLVPPSESRESLAEEVKDTESKVFRTANLDFLVDSEKNKPWRSASAKSQDTATGHISLKAYGALIRDHAKRLLELVAMVRGDKPEGFDVEGFEKLDDWDLQELSNIALTLASIDYHALGDFGETAQRELMARLIAQALPEASEALKQKIRDDLMKVVIKPKEQPEKMNSGGEGRQGQSGSKASNTGGGGKPAG